MSRSAGILLYRRSPHLEVFLIHPGGPYFAGRDAGVWGIPKGLVEEGEDIFLTAKREFIEETGFSLPADGFLELAPIRKNDGKRIYAWAVEGDGDPSTLRSNTCTIEWPPRSGKKLEILEVDRGEWFSVDVAMEKMARSSHSSANC